MSSGSSASSDADEAPSDPTLQRLENEAVRSLLPPGLLDDRGQKLKQEVDWCLSSNNWYFTAGGVIIGGVASFQSGNLRPLAAAAIVAPALDWFYSREACAEVTKAFEDHKRALMKQQHESVDALKRDLRQQFHSLHSSESQATSGASK